MTDLWRLNSDISLVFRADFIHEAEWAEVAAAIAEPQTPDGFQAHVAFVDEPANEGLTAERLVAQVPDDSTHRFAFVVDAETLTHPERPVLVVNLFDYTEDGADERRGPRYGTSFRVIPAEMWSVQNNLSIANMDWYEFADSADADGIFRGFS